MSKVIRVENLSKAYQLGEIGTGTISRDLDRYWAKMRGREDPFLKIGEVNDRTVKGVNDIVWSLKDLNFEIEQGDAVGIIGRNGAGKSTLLKILSRVTAPTTGSVKIKGRIASLLEVGTGFHPELSGRENIYLNGAILGMRKAEIKRKFDEIVDFSGVERYIDTPVKRYSSGMYVRLAFAVAAHLESEIMIVDEVLAVGDAEFQKKCLGKMGEVSGKEGRTVLFVSHNLGSVAQLCAKGVLLDKGNLVGNGTISDIVDQYSDFNSNLGDLIFSNNNNVANFRNITIYGANNNEKINFFIDEEIKIRFKLEIVNLDDRYNLFVTVLDSRKNRVFSSEIELEKRKIAYELTIKPNFLVRGNYSLHCFIHLPKIKQIDVIEDAGKFTIVDNGSPLAIHGGYNYGNVFGNCFWK
ncbi:MAG: Polysaccharide transporter, ATP-binding protein [Mucilaginibacter sp.]|nr:Polysaccharide transporter, ATP-binding protein [Mucilaginibacter sp.]